MRENVGVVNSSQMSFRYVTSASCLNNQLSKVKLLLVLFEATNAAIMYYL